MDIWESIDASNAATDLNALHARGQQMLGAFQARELDTLRLTTGNPDTLEARYRTGLNNFNLNEAIAAASKAAREQYGMGSEWWENAVKNEIWKDDDSDSDGDSDGGGNGGGNGDGDGDGDDDGGGDGGGGDKDDEESEWLKWQKEKGMRSAEGAMRGFFAKFFGAKDGDQLATWAVSQIALGYDAETLIMQMRFGNPTAKTTDSMYLPQAIRDIYDERFPAMAMRDANKAAPITEAQYVQQEAGLWETIDKYGLGPYVTSREMAGQDPVTDMIAHGISVAEFADRAQDAEEMLYNANPETVAMLKRDYKWDRDDFMAAMVDPDFMGDGSLAEAKRAYQASKLGGMSKRVLGSTSFSKATNRSLLNMDVQEREVAAQMGQFAGMTSSTMFSSGMTGDELAEGVWGSGKARAAMRRQNEARRAGFSGTTGGMISNAGNTSLGSVTTT